MEGFEVYGKTRKSTAVSEPKATVNSAGNITLNGKALDLWGEKYPDYVTILVNKKTQTVALQPSNPDEPNAYKLREVQKSPSRVVGAKGMFEHYGFALNETNSYDVAAVNGALCFSIKPPKK